MVTEVSPEQPEKALSPIVVTLLGIVMDFSPEQPKKAELPNFFTLLGITVVKQPRINVFVSVAIMALHLSRESYVVLPLSTIIEFRLLHP